MRFWRSACGKVPRVPRRDGKGKRGVQSEIQRQMELKWSKEKVHLGSGTAQNDVLGSQHHKSIVWWMMTTSSLMTTRQTRVSAFSSISNCERRQTRELEASQRSLMKHGSSG